MAAMASDLTHLAHDREGLESSIRYITGLTPKGCPVAFRYFRWAMQWESPESRVRETRIDL